MSIYQYLDLRTIDADPDLTYHTNIKKYLESFSLWVRILVDGRTVERIDSRAVHILGDLCNDVNWRLPSPEMGVRQWKGTAMKRVSMPFSIADAGPGDYSARDDDPNDNG